MYRVSFLEQIWIIWDRNDGLIPYNPHVCGTKQFVYHTVPVVFTSFTASLPHPCRSLHFELGLHSG